MLRSLSGTFTLCVNFGFLSKSNNDDFEKEEKEVCLLVNTRMRGRRVVILLQQCGSIRKNSRTTNSTQVQSGTVLPSQLAIRTLAIENVEYYTQIKGCFFWQIVSLTCPGVTFSYI